ncbi:MAG: hypothetical protein COA44_08675 [Arcobacter sp.]|nr:MAG: hypothetical protein COA44_08675 [Arcobacter sp.]
MKTGIPKEVKEEEYRVSLQPENISLLVSQGHTLYVQEGASVGSDFSDEDYKNAGAIIVAEVKEVFERSDMIVKVKESQESEYDLLQVKWRGCKCQ